MTTKITDKNVSVFANAGVQWQSVVVADGSTELTAEAGKGYFIDTTSGTQTVNFPQPDNANIGDTIIIKDFARKFGTNNVTIASNLFEGTTNAVTLSTNDDSRTFVYAGGTRGYTLIQDGATTGVGALYIAATGGTVTTSGNFKIHTFTGDGCFVVSDGGNSAGSNTVDYLVVGGGGAGGFANGGGGGGGAGGLRYSDCTYSTPAPDPSAGTALPVSAQTYPITVGGGGSSKTGSPDYQSGGDGSNSIFSTITSAGGGGGGGGCGPTKTGRNGGSGGGGGKDNSPVSGGSGNTPPVSPPQGNNGGVGGGPGPLNNTGGGGGGASAAGSDRTNSPALKGGDGGNGLVISINGSCAAYAGGGGANSEGQPAPAQGQGGSGGGGSGSATSNGNAGTANTGGGGGGADSQPDNSRTSGAGGKGVVIIRYQFQAS